LSKYKAIQRRKKLVVKTAPQKCFGSIIFKFKKKTLLNKKRKNFYAEHLCKSLYFDYREEMLSLRGLSGLARARILLENAPKVAAVQLIHTLNHTAQG
jgi:hypothetical protein